MLRMLLSQWLQEQAADALRKKAAEASGRTPSEDATEGENAEPPAPPEVGFVFAMGVESGGLEDVMQDVVHTRGHGFATRRGMLCDRPTILFLSGAGRENAARATEILLETHRPKWVFSAGFAGGLDDTTERNDIVMIDRVVNESGDSCSLDLRVDRNALEAIPHVHAGTLLTVDRIVDSPDEKRRLGQDRSALVVDMETWAVAETCRRFGVPLIGVRIVLDGVDDELPADLDGVLKAQEHGLARKAGAVLGAIWNRPSTVKDLYNLREKALLTSDRLAKFLVSMIEQLPRDESCSDATPGA